MNKQNMHYGPNGAVNDPAVKTSWDEGLDKIVKGEGFVPKESESFISDRERVLNLGAGLLKDGTQYPLEKVNVQGDEDYGSIRDAY